MAQRLSGAPSDLPNIQILREFARKSLSESLSQIDGPKELVLQVELMKAMDRVFGALFLKEHGVSKIFKMDEALPCAAFPNRLFIVDADVGTMKEVADLINRDNRSDKKCRYKIYMVPRKLHVCELALEKEGVFGYISIEDLNLGLIPLDEDIMSLEMPTFFKSFFLEKDFMGIHSTAMSLVDIQSVFGTIPKVYGQGRASEMTLQLTNLLMEKKNLTATNDIGYLFLFDRDVDFASVLLTQLTYEGLLDETFGISCGYINFGPDVTRTQESVKLSLNNQDEIFKEIRNTHFSKVFKFLSEKAKKFQTDNQQRRNMSIGEMKNFVSNELRGVKHQQQCLALYIGACEVIMHQKNDDFEEQLQTELHLIDGSCFQENLNYIEEIINRQCSIIQSLRLLSLLSYTNDGLPSKVYRSLKTAFLQSYGHEHLLTLFALQKMGLFMEQELINKLPSKVVAAAVSTLPRHRPFRTITRKLNLIPTSSGDYNLENPTDIGYVFSGAYIPLICNFIKKILRKGGVEGLEEVIKHLPGSSVAENRFKSARGNSTFAPKRVAVVYFLGGVTYAEIAALRLLGRQIDCKFIIATTAIINGNSLMESIMEDMTVKKPYVTHN